MVISLSQITASIAFSRVHFTSPTTHGVANAREIGGRRRIDVEHRVRMLLEIGRRDVRVRLAFHRALDDRGLVLARCDERDLSRLHDRRYTHRDRFGRHVVLAEEIGGGVAARDGVERDAAGARLGAGSRLVEADVPGLADAENLKIDSASVSDRGLVRVALVVDVVARNVAARNVDVPARTLMWLNRFSRM